MLNQIFDLHVDEWQETNRIAEGSRFRVTYKMNVLHFYLAHAFAHPQLDDFQYAGASEFPGLISKVETEAQLQHAYKDRPWSSVDRRRHAAEFCDALLAAGSGDGRAEAMHGLWELSVRKDHHEGYHVFTNARVAKIVHHIVPEKVSNLQSRDDEAEKLSTVFEVAALACRVVWSLAITQHMRTTLVAEGAVEALLELLKITLTRCIDAGQSANAAAAAEQSADTQDENAPTESFDPAGDIPGTALTKARRDECQGVALGALSVLIVDPVVRAKLIGARIYPRAQSPSSPGC